MSDDASGTDRASVANERLLSLLQGIQSKTRFDHPVTRFQLIATHISYVLLAGPYAYKFKRPLDLGFLDFTTLGKRRSCCEEELRLNRRLAPQLYLEVVPITGSAAVPVLRGTRPVIEYCVKMMQFPQEAQLDRVLERGELTACHVDDLATQVGAFHASGAAAAADTPFGTASQIGRYALENCDLMDTAHGGVIAMLQDLRAWTLERLGRLDNVFRTRKQNSRIRECHGDMHLSNMVLLNDRVVIFDCIEFNETLRWIDVMNEIAFLLMDLDYRERGDLGYRFLNRYLEYTGDYPGLVLLDFYRVYRSLVRAKVAYLQYRQSGTHDESLHRFSRHVELATTYTEQRARPLLLITCGLSGAGKTSLTDRLMERSGAVRLRSDIERKRLEGLSLDARTGSPVGDLYRPEMTRRTYERLLTLAREVLNSRFAVMVDATFLKRVHRQAFLQLAQELRLPFRILHVKANETTLRERILCRQAQDRDASEATVAVLDDQLRFREPLTAEEEHFAVTVHTDARVDPDWIWNQVSGWGT
ncbi:MAG: AAA family ATPase [Gammaproteobacteria bacterium]